MKQTASLAMILSATSIGLGAGLTDPPIHTVEPGQAGFYAISGSSVRCEPGREGGLDLKVFTRPAEGTEAAAADPHAAVATRLAAGEAFEFDTFLGYLRDGEQVQLSLTPREAALDVAYQVVPVPSIEVSAFPEKEEEASWQVLALSANAPWEERARAWGHPARMVGPGPDSARLQLPAEGEFVARAAAYRVPQSGFYALHQATAQSTPETTRALEAVIYAGRDPSPKFRASVPSAAAQSVSLNGEIGYLEKGDAIFIVFKPASGGGGDSPPDAAEVDFSATLVEWAPRRAPLRVKRGDDGLLDVFEPAAPRLRVDIPAERWINVPVPVQDADATDAILQALAKAQDSRSEGGYAGIRLEQGRRYVVASRQEGGSLFLLKGMERIVFDGNGATLLMNSPELQRQGIDLFRFTDSRKVVIADLIVEDKALPYAIGDIVSVSPMRGGNQTVTFKLEPGSADPVKDIRADGMAEGYAYDPHVPGRLADGTWSHYPGASGENPQIKATGRPGEFTHTVTRTNNSIPKHAKWVVKNKRAGVVYLVANATSEDITLSGIQGRACGGGAVRNWGSSGVNVLDCRFEPRPGQWLSSTADSIHGRGAEGVWVENTIIRGICEDIMNTYGVSMLVVDDGRDKPNSIALRMSRRGKDGAISLGSPPAETEVRVGDTLLFFNPRIGRVLGHAKVMEAAASGNLTLSNPIPDLDFWQEGDDRRSTTVYNTRAAARFFVRDSQFLDSMRFGIFIKASGGAIFNNHFEGLSSPAIYVANEPEWPEGPPATHLWVQGNSFSHNGFSYFAKHRKFLGVDPADISIYTRKLRNPGDVQDYSAHLTSGQFANSHMKLVGNIFHDWRGRGIAMRNSRNAEISGNIFLPPLDDAAVRSTLARDSVKDESASGDFAAIFVSSANGVRVGENTFYGFADRDRDLITGPDVDMLTNTGNQRHALSQDGLVSQILFSEWSGIFAKDTAPSAPEGAHAEIKAAEHQAGRLGAGLYFGGGESRAGMHGVASEGSFTVALWVRVEGVASGPEVIFTQGGQESGVCLANNSGRLSAGIWRDSETRWLDLGPALPGIWQHVTLICDSGVGKLSGYVNGLEMNQSELGPLSTFTLGAAPALFGRTSTGTRVENKTLSAGEGAYHGTLDDFHLYHRALPPVEIRALALRH